MKIYFQHPEFDAQLIRALSLTPYGCADLGECLATASRITPGDFNQWFNEWFALAEKVRAEAEKSENKGHLVSAYFGYLRASNYYRASHFFLYGAPVDDRLLKSFDFHTQTFAKAMLLSSYDLQSLEIPFKDSSLPAHFFPSIKGPASPTLIINSGYDGTRQEAFMTCGFAAIQRGYHVLVFDGPGQGEALIRKKIHMLPEWDSVLYSVLHVLHEKKEINQGKIALLGLSWGGLLGPKACSDEHRIAALAAIPGQYDAMESLKRFPKEVIDDLKLGKTDPLKEYIPFLMRDKMMAAKLRSKMWVHGVDDPVSLFMEWLSYNLVDKAKEIRCPTLIIDTEEEEFSKGQAKQLFDALTCQKEYILMKSRDGAGAHCAAGALLQLHQKVFDWFDETLKKTPNHLQELIDSMETSHEPWESLE